MKIEYLDVKEQEEFTRIVNTLLAESCIFQYTKIKNFDRKERNADYLFINEHYEVFEEYLYYAGFLLYKDRSSYMGMFYLQSLQEDGKCHIRLNKLETQLLLLLRNYYEEKMIELDTSLTIRISVNELIRLLVDVFSLTSAKPSNFLLQNALNNLQRLNIIQKYTQGDEEMIWILPYITCVLTLEKIESILQIIHQKGEQEDEIKEDAVSELAVL
ncbi:DUF4194 domain-containing protein [Amedibacterium intestinale]|uniref:DUF4194 domain-containing protein n=1 Tax=Amedibacterium intestinale TaxID=2583452 RepID=UPI000E46E351|nr:DUF4194 domain-containing protein [Amedibacterium intestinale]RHO19473.1 DUF4194 domain-containing protein [Eubacterium sp. AM18-26]RHO22855.1 DUF4194 domain-containing protein [Eubacterium sp. AM18-10LB-B]RHO31216.1 DUF4194 domain-containing protein [Erysipelotrichaceae bacterium AM17-60]